MSFEGSGGSSGEPIYPFIYIYISYIFYVGEMSPGIRAAYMSLYGEGGEWERAGEEREARGELVSGRRGETDGYGGARQGRAFNNRALLIGSRYDVGDIG